MQVFMVMMKSLKAEKIIVNVSKDIEEYERVSDISSNNAEINISIEIREQYGTKKSRKQELEITKKNNEELNSILND